ncbi:MAG: hypothetical protein WKF67_13560, partial [Rubrobacteraceae bacterium]
MPRKKGAGHGKWKSLKTGRFVSAYYAKRNPLRVARVERKERRLSYHETRLQPGDPSEGPLGQVIAYTDDEGKTFFPGQEG